MRQLSLKAFASQMWDLNLDPTASKNLGLVACLRSQCWGCEDRRNLCTCLSDSWSCRISGLYVQRENPISKSTVERDKGTSVFHASPSRPPPLTRSYCTHMHHTNTHTHKTKKEQKVIINSRNMKNNTQFIIRQVYTLSLHD